MGQILRFVKILSTSPDLLAEKEPLLSKIKDLLEESITLLTFFQMSPNTKEMPRKIRGILL
ncbi:hypothetical protein HMPREF3291_13150 [Bacillus sp. HMSC76G11]|nr:hypothetical protein HMPREF3291_13150 [Bacillus sp. HMSC76G11]